MLNVIVCGTPGTGKSSLIAKARQELSQLGFNFINVSEFAKEHGCTNGYDEEFGCDILDDDKLIELLGNEVKKGEQKNVIESIHGDLLPAESVNLVFVCRADNKQLYDRLKNRNYQDNKISNNLEAEIFQTVLDEVKECYPEEIVHQLVNDETDDLERNTQYFTSTIRKKLHSKE